MRFTIRYQLLLPLLALMLGLVGATTWSAWESGQRARQQFEKQIEDIATTVNTATFPINAQTLHLMKGLSGADFILCNEQRQPITDGQDKFISTLADLPDLLPSPGDSLTQRIDQPVRVGTTDYLCRGVPLRHNVRWGAVLYICYPESLWQEAFRQTLRPALTLGIAGGMISALLSFVLTRQFSKRIQELERRTRSIADGDFSPMPLPRRNDELRDLGRSVNEMALRMTQYQDTIRQTERLRILGQVGGGLAHQLRNGVAGARLAIQLHAQEFPTPLGAEALNVALRQLCLVEMHLKKFLDLGKAVELQCKPFRLDDLVRETIDLVGPQCRHAHIDLRTVPPGMPTMEMIGDPAQLSHLLLNVLTNGIEAAGPGGWVALTWGEAPNDTAFLEIRDSGPGPAPEVGSRLFEPFVTGKREGVGLGLMVARQVAQAHGGTIHWRRESESTCFRIELPREQSFPSTEPVVTS